MPVLTNSKWERFCREYIKSGNATQAYHLAGYKRTPSATANAARLITNDNIQSRLAELGERVLAEGEVDLQWWLKRVKAAADLPAESSNHRDKIAATKASMQALDLIAQHLGALKPRQHEISGPGGSPIASSSETLAVISGVGGRNPSEMSDAELRLALAQQSQVRDAIAATVPNLTSETPPQS